MPGCDNSWVDEFDQVSHGGGYAILHQATGQVVTPKYDVGWGVWVEGFGTEACVDHTSVGTRRENGHASSSDLSSEEPFVHDQRIGFAHITAPCVVTSESSLVLGDSFDLTAARE